MYLNIEWWIVTKKLVVYRVVMNTQYMIISLNDNALFSDYVCSVSGVFPGLWM